MPYPVNNSACDPNSVKVTLYGQDGRPMADIGLPPSDSPPQVILHTNHFFHLVNNKYVLCTGYVYHAI